MNERHPEAFGDHVRVDLFLFREERYADLALARPLGLEGPARRALELGAVDVQRGQDHGQMVMDGRFGLASSDDVVALRSRAGESLHDRDRGPSVAGATGA